MRQHTQTHAIRDLPASPDTAYERMATALTDPYYLFSRDQVAWLMGHAQRWGWQAGHAEGFRHGERHAREALAELNLDAIRRAIDTPAFSERALRVEGYRQIARREADIAAAHPWRTDHPGGPVPVWDDEPIGADR